MFIPQIKTIGAISPADLHHSLCMDITKGTKWNDIVLVNFNGKSYVKIIFYILLCLVVSGKKKKKKKKVYVGPKNLTTPAHFVHNPRPSPRRGKCPRTHNESPNGLEMLLRTILSSAFQNLEGKNDTPSKPSRALPEERTSTVGHTQGYGVGAIQGKAVTSTLNVPN